MVSHIFVSFNEFITCVQFGYLKDEAVVLSQPFGVSDGNFRTVSFVFGFKFNSFSEVVVSDEVKTQVRLDQDEYITGLSGVLAKTGEIVNLTFRTNRRKHGPIGRSSDGFGANCLRIEIDPAIRDRSEFSGFFGTNSYTKGCLTSIGIYVSPTPRTGTVVKREYI